MRIDDLEDVSLIVWSESPEGHVLVPLMSHDGQLAVGTRPISYMRGPLP